MKKIFLPFFILCATGFLIGGFFCANFSLAADDPLSLKLCLNDVCQQQDWSEKTNNNSSYWVINSATSSLVSSPLDLTACATATLVFNYKRYYTYASGTSDWLFVEAATDGASWQQLFAVQTVTTSFATATDIAVPCGYNWQLRFRGTADADAKHGVGFKNVTLTLNTSASTTDEESSDEEDDDGDPASSTDDGSITTTTEDLATTTASTTLSYGSSAVVINEIFPAGASEWLELYNNSSSSIDLGGWVLFDRYGSAWASTSLSGIIDSAGFLVLSDIKGKLNNASDTLILKSPAGTIIDQVSYEGFSNKDDQSWARIKDGQDSDSDADFAATITLTPAAANVITAKISSSGGSSSGKATAVATIATATTTATTTAVVATTTIDYSDLIISELLANPIGEDGENEFIELQNIGTTTLDVAKLVLMDGSGNKHVIKAQDASSTVLAAGGYLALFRKRTGLALNNTGVETVSLLASDLSLLDQIEYAAEKTEGISYSRQADGYWRWVMTPTPDAANAADLLFSDEESDQTVAGGNAAGGENAKTAKAAASKKSSAKKGYVRADWAGLKDYSAGDLLQLTGVVAVAPGVLGGQYFYFISPDNAAWGAQVYCYKKDFPDLAIGDLITVKGELSLSSAGRRLKIGGRDQIQHGQPPAAAPLAIKVDTADIGEDYEGGFVEVGGTILEISGRNLIIDSSGTEAKIYLNSAINVKDLGAKTGDQITAQGLVGKSASGYRLLPRDANDIKLTPGQVKGAFVAAQPAAPFNYYLLALAAFALALAAALGYKLYRQRNQHK